ncbi:uncharacterized protein TEOVI_000694400 [Trypanosoma equiperdum]|uniref:Variant surface glycoprotein (VSG) n=1 Tax=Trypanosoma equiperdum TaxID=5694 RepID=A0A1G4HY60_TRYEQ|nr:hypothetical protein TEOVI_000694400 [Trypanosoma equiperdum]
MAKLKVDSENGSTAATFLGAKGKVIAAKLTPTATEERTTAENKRKERTAAEDQASSKNHISIFQIKPLIPTATKTDPLRVCAATRTGAVPTAAQCQDTSTDRDNILIIGGKLLTITKLTYSRQKASNDNYAGATAAADALPTKMTKDKLLKQIKKMEEAAAKLTYTDGSTKLKVAATALNVKETIEKAICRPEATYEKSEVKPAVDAFIAQEY